MNHSMPGMEAVMTKVWQMWISPLIQKSVISKYSRKQSVLQINWSFPSGQQRRERDCVNLNWIQTRMSADVVAVTWRWQEIISDGPTSFATRHIQERRTQRKCKRTASFRSVWHCCRTCEKTFPEGNGLSHHMRVHSQNKQREETMDNGQPWALLSVLQKVFHFCPIA